mgnify:FL=1
MDVEGKQPYVDQRSAQRLLTVLLERVKDMFQYVTDRPGGSHITIGKSKEVHSCSFCKCFSSCLFSNIANSFSYFFTHSVLCFFHLQMYITDYKAKSVHEQRQLRTAHALRETYIPADDKLGGMSCRNNISTDCVLPGGLLDQNQPLTFDYNLDSVGTWNLLFLTVWVTVQVATLGLLREQFLRALTPASIQLRAGPGGLVS